MCRWCECGNGHEWNKLVAEITYRESFPGIQILIDDGRCDRKTAARQEIRDVGNELRRWQEYGKLLPGRGN